MAKFVFAVGTNSETFEVDIPYIKGIVELQRVINKNKVILVEIGEAEVLLKTDRIQSAFLVERTDQS